MTPQAQFEAWWRLPEQTELISYVAARRAWLAAWSAAQSVQRERDVKIALHIYDEHKRSGSYPLDMGGLALEIISALRTSDAP